MTIHKKDVYAAATEDMDTLTFGAKILLRGFNSKKEPITEINYDEMLKGKKSPNPPIISRLAIKPRGIRGPVHLMWLRLL
jgi:hypothetical protein